MPFIPRAYSPSPKAPERRTHASINRSPFSGRHVHPEGRTEVRVAPARGKCATVSNYGYGVARCTKGDPSPSRSVRGREGAKRTSQGMPGAEGLPTNSPLPFPGEIQKGSKGQRRPRPFRSEGDAARDRRGCPKRQRFALARKISETPSLSQSVRSPLPGREPNDSQAIIGPTINNSPRGAILRGPLPLGGRRLERGVRRAFARGSRQRLGSIRIGRCRPIGGSALLISRSAGEG